MMSNNRSEIRGEYIVTQRADSIHDGRNKWGSDDIPNDFTCWVVSTCLW